MKLLKNNNHRQFLITLSQLIHEKKFKEAEKKLLDFIEKTLLYSNDSIQISDKKAICQTIYCSFNKFYLNWLKRNKTNIKKERNDLSSCKHPNFLVFHCTKMAEMDDLLFNLINYLDSPTNKNEITYELNCYKKNLSI